MRCSKCGMELSSPGQTCSRCGKAASVDFNYSNMERELLHTVWEEEAIPDISGSSVLYQQNASRILKRAGMSEMNQMNQTEETEEFKKQPVKLAVALAATAAVFAGAAFFLQTFPTGYSYERTEAEYQNCLAMMAKKDYPEALKSVELLLQQQSDSLEYLALKNTICEKNGDTKAQADVLKQIIAEDKDNYQAYEKLLALYVEAEDQEGIVKLAENAPNSTIASMIDEYLIETPYLELTPGLYDASQTLSITSEKGNSIYYTLDGSSPQERGSLYTAPISLEQDHFYSVRAVCKNESGAYGDEAAGEYQIGINADRSSMVTVIEQPAVYPDSGTYSTQQRITIDVPIGYQAYYSWSLGTELTPENGTLYTGGVTMPEGSSELAVIVTDGNGNCSEVKQVSYSYQP